MYVKRKWNRSVTQFTHTVVGYQPTCHANLIDVLSERTEIRDDIDVSGFRKLRLCLRTATTLFCLRKFSAKSVDFGRMFCTRLSHRCGNRLLDQLAFAFHSLQLPLVLSDDPRFFPNLFADLLLPLFFSLPTKHFFKVDLELLQHLSFQL